jgi:hypothetical protein
MTSCRNRGARRRVAWLGVLAVLIQAVLFGWHHHALALPTVGDQPFAAIANPASQPSPAAGEDGCEICAALHHLSTSPVEFASLSLPRIAAAAVHLPELVLVPEASGRAFRARAPPRAQHYCV